MSSSCRPRRTSISAMRLFLMRSGAGPWPSIEAHGALLAPPTAGEVPEATTENRRIRLPHPRRSGSGCAPASWDRRTVRAVGPAQARSWGPRRRRRGDSSVIAGMRGHEPLLGGREIGRVPGRRAASRGAFWARPQAPGAPPHTAARPRLCVRRGRARRIGLRAALPLSDGCPGGQ